MKGFGSVILLTAGFQIISSQEYPQRSPNFPPECTRPPPGVEKPHECCKIPAFFTDEDFAECGFQKLDGSGPPRRGPPDCSKQLCMMEKYKLLTAEKTIDHEAVAAFLEKWGSANEAFKPAVTEAKERCVGKTLPGPPQVCDANKLIFCTTSTLFSNCPVWEETDGCKTLKDHLDLCKPFFKH